MVTKKKHTQQKLKMQGIEYWNPADFRQQRD